MKSKAFVTLILLFSVKATWAKGVSFHAAVGLPAVTMLNPDKSQSMYSGVGLLGRLVIPVWENKGFGADFSLSGRYLDLNNTANSSTQRETGNHIGPGAGLRFNLFRLFVAADYHLVRARHFWVGVDNSYKEFNYSLLSYSAGLRWEPSKSFSMAVSYQASSATIDKSELSLSDDVAYTDTVIWLHLMYSTGEGVGKFFKNLFN